VRNYVSWVVAFVAVFGALIFLGVSVQAWVAYVGITVVIVGGLLFQAIGRRRTRH
jgi:flagellar motor component MotA